MNGYDIQQYNRLLELTKEVEVTVSTSGTKIILDSKKENLGYFDTISDALYFIFGYKTGINKGIIVEIEHFKKKK